MKSYNLTNRNGHQIWQPLLVTSVLTGTYQVETILTLLNPRLQHLITLARYAMSLRFNCACLSKKHIYSFYHTRANTANWPVDILEPCLDMGQPSTYHWLITMYGKGGSYH